MDKTSLPQDWELTIGKSTVLIGICDDGIDSTHEDLYYNDTNASHMSGDVGHGTHEAGIAGVSDSNLLIAKFLGQDGGTDTMVANGIKWWVDNGAKVINL